MLIKLWTDRLRDKQIETIKPVSKTGFIRDRGRIRTPNPQSRNLIFYPVELRGRLEMQKYTSISFLQILLPGSSDFLAKFLKLSIC